jgi:urocanate reductase
MISRKDFIKGAAAGAVGVATMGVLGGCTNTAVAVEEMSFDKEADVVIVGAGGAGVAAALEAASAGASVLILEKAGIAGGTTNYSGGVMQASATEAQKAYTAYQNDTPENHFQLWSKAGEGYVDDELVKDLAYGAPEHIEWLTGLGLKFTSVYGHTHIPYVDEALFADRIHVYEGGGAAGAGNILVMAMLNAAEGKGAVTEYETEVTRLLMDADRTVVGVTAVQNGQEINIKANKGVILAASSIDHNVEMAKDLSPQHHWDLTSQVCLCAPTDTGDGIRMGMEAGAALAGFGGTIDFCGKTGAATDNRNPLFPSFIVNQAGRRFVCEDATYAYHYRAIFQQVKQMDGPTYMIFGQSSLGTPGCAWTEESLQQDLTDGVVKTADTIEELAAAIGIDGGNLAATLEAWNADMESGKDTDYGRKTGLMPISGPFYAYQNVSFNLGSIGGVKINTDGQALRPNNEPIPHLYAAGMNAGGWIGPYYPGSGTAVMGLIHWGRKAGAHAAR